MSPCINKVNQSVIHLVIYLVKYNKNIQEISKKPLGGRIHGYRRIFINTNDNSFLPMIIKVLIFYQVSKLNQKMRNRNKGKRNLVENYLNRK